MQRARSAAAAICFAGRMFVTGGCDVVQFFNSVEVFDGNKWGELNPMVSNRCRHGSLVFQGKIVLLIFGLIIFIKLRSTLGCWRV